MPWLFLIVSLVGAWFTWNTYHPSSRWQVVALSFFAAWFTGELALWHIAWQAIATALFVSAGALDAWPGWLGLAITLVSWVGLVRLNALSRSSADVIDATLREGLGLPEDHPIRRRISVSRLVVPLYLRDRRVARVKDLSYGPAGRRNRLDVYRARNPALPPPESPGPDAGAPVLLQIHGGAWVIGDKSQQGLPLMLEAAAAGWVCVAINYRLSPRAHWPDHLVDCKRALAWIREHIADYGGDPSRVVVTGGSAGGHLAAMVALTANEPQYQPGFEAADTSVIGCVPFYGVYDMTGVFTRPSKRKRESKRAPSKPPGARLGGWFERAVTGTTLAENPGAFVDASPISHLRADAPPFFVIHGSADNLVPVEQAREFSAALRDVSRAPVLYAEIPGASHAFDVFHSVRTSTVIHGVDVFLERLASGQVGDGQKISGQKISGQGPSDQTPDRSPATGTAPTGPTTTGRTAPPEIQPASPAARRS